ncbi:MAG: flagellar hook-associated protein FlgL [Gammaproteobacteria bacterium]|nr:flagellar hook-associated protein FlgL [Gammaproteobacteria bacterium]
MGLRLSTMQMHATGLAGMLDLQKAVSRTQEQIAGNKRVLTPGDDPIASTRILALNQELALNDQYNSNLETLTNRLQREEVAVSGVSDLVLRAQELVTQAGNGALNKEQRGFIAIEMQSLVKSMAQMMNSRDASGEFIFAGYQGKSEPFVLGDDGRYRYVGDEGQRSIQIASATSVASSDSGKEVFVDVKSVVNTVVGHANGGNHGVPPAIIGGERIVDHEAFAEFYPEDVIIEFRPLDEVEPALLTYNIKQSSDGRILKENQPYLSGELIEFGGAGVRISGEPAVGDTFIVESSNKKGLLTNLEDFIVSLKDLSDSATDKQELAQQVANTLGNLNNAQTTLLETRSSVGARLNLVEASRSNNAEFELVIKSALSEIADLDYAKAISQLSQESFILEAAQASFARVSKLSIFKYI